MPPDARAAAMTDDGPTPDEAARPVLYEPATTATAELPNRIRDAGFELAGTSGSEWRPYGEGFEADPAERRSGRQSIRCRNADTKSTRGAIARVTLKQKQPRPVLCEVWTRCRNVDAPPSPEYSLYADVAYADGSHLWAQFAACPTDASEWQRVERVIRPEKSIDFIDLHCLFRNTAGTVWFDDAACRELDPEKILEFDGQLIRTRTELWPLPPARLMQSGPPLIVLLQSHADDGAIRIIPTTWSSVPGMPAVRATLDDEPRGLSGDITVFESQIGSLFVDVRLRTARATPQPVTVIVGERFRDPLPGRWWHDGLTAISIHAQRDHSNLEWFGSGKTGYASRYPLAVVTYETGGGRAILPRRAPGPPRPQIVRFGYDGPMQLLYAAADVVVQPIAAANPAPTTTRESLTQSRPGQDSDSPPILAIEIQPLRKGADDFRSAWARFWPYRDGNCRRFGLWMPFAAISRVKHPEDFGFAFKEGVDDLAYDEAHDILTFHYAEPQSFWLKLPPDSPRDARACVAALQRAAADSKHPQHREARAALASACRTASGGYYVWPRREPWCDGAVFALNPAPSVPGEVTKARVNFDEAEAARYFAKGVDGEYLDSLDGWADVLNFDTEQLAAANVPLTFDPRTRRICLLNAASIWEYAADLRRRIEPRGKLLMANYCPTRYWWMAPLCDVLGQETNWKIDGRWTPMSDAEMWYRRALAGRRPYCLLMNTDFSNWTIEDTERYIMRSAAYGFFPGFFSHDAATKQYFESPALYERDRPLFRQWMPLIREIAAAGWVPQSAGNADPPSLRVERFQTGDRGPAYWTVHNPGGAAIDGSIRIDGATLAPGSTSHPDTISLDELPEGKRVQATGAAGSWVVRTRLDAGETRVYRFAPRPTTQPN